jgi:hypothetical protein
MSGVIVPKVTAVEIKAEYNNSKFEAVVPFLQITYAPGLKAERQMELLWKEHRDLRGEHSDLQKRFDAGKDKASNDFKDWQKRSDAAKDKAANDLKDANYKAATDLQAAKNQLQAQKKASDADIASLREQLCEKIRIAAQTKERVIEERILLATMSATVLAFKLSLHSPVWPRIAPLMLVAWLSVAAWVYGRRSICVTRKLSLYRSGNFFAAFQASLNNISSGFQKAIGTFRTS